MPRPPAFIPIVHTTDHADATATAATRKRTRLPPEIRSQLILDAALVEFSKHGFSAARIEGIARHAGLSKSGIYAHFPSKDAIFEALLVSTLHPPSLPPLTLNADPQQIHCSIENFVETLYANLMHPRVLKTLRLVITESDRCRNLIGNWRKNILIPLQSKHEAHTQKAIASGHVNATILADEFLLLVAPAMFAVLHAIIFHDENGIDVVDDLKRAHKRLLLELFRLDAIAE